MRNLPESAAIAPLNRVSGVGRSDAATLPPLVRGADDRYGAIPRPTAAVLPAEDVARFEQLVFGDLPAAPPWGPDKRNVRAPSPLQAADPTGVQAADRIAATLRHLSQVRGL